MTSPVGTEMVKKGSKRAFEDEEGNQVSEKRLKVGHGVRASGSRPKRTFRFLDLPGEIRNVVYELVVVSDCVTEVFIERRERYTIKLPRVTKVCKQIRYESLSIYWHENQFWLPPLFGSNEHENFPEYFLKRIVTAGYCKHLTSVRISWPTDNDQAWLGYYCRLLASLSFTVPGFNSKVFETVCYDSRNLTWENPATNARIGPCIKKVLQLISSAHVDKWQPEQLQTVVGAIAQEANINSVWNATAIVREAKARLLTEALA